MGVANTCKTVDRKIGLDVRDDGTAELSSWTPIDEPLSVGPAGESPAVRARFVGANARGDDASTHAARQQDRRARPARPGSQSPLHRGRQLDAIKTPVVLQPDYISMIGGIRAVMDDEIALRDALASGTRATRRSAVRTGDVTRTL
jgi:hypothetical protein